MKLLQRIRPKPSPFPKLCEKKEESRVFLNAQEANKLINIFEGHRLYPIIYLTIYCGLRRSEILGLKCDAVDLKKLEIFHKAYSYQRINYRQKR